MQREVSSEWSKASPKKDLERTKLQAHRRPCERRQKIDFDAAERLSSTMYSEFSRDMPGICSRALFPHILLRPYRYIPVQISRLLHTLPSR
jgi:hypothetical protein